MSHLPEVVEFLKGRSDLLPLKAGHKATGNCDRHDELDFEDVKGRENEKREMVAAAAGSRTVLMLQGIST